ncbi:hypothetical protein [Nonomuraea turcica]|uniref:hypothetical protein n=1 Tax=Nonomuraea sp. G32 TaxID=3067274 RepID=UPI00273C3F60|nr:hypothetical protein [Nonomuraea sp. G32]MDP4503947.1 hypothetical protein [Nonomuraea sp. G32]
MGTPGAALLAPPAEFPASLPGIVVADDAVPYELVGAITPWNFLFAQGGVQHQDDVSAAIAPRADEGAPVRRDLLGQ